MKKRAVKIVVERYEGRIGECDGPHAHEGGNVWAKANAMLRSWSRTAPVRGYHKCGFEVTWDDGDTYEGRIDLDRGFSETIEQHMTIHCTYHAGRAKNPWMGEERYRAYLRDVVKPEAQAAYAKVLDECELGWTEPTGQESWLEAMGAL